MNILAKFNNNELRIYSENGSVEEKVYKNIKRDRELLQSFIDSSSEPIYALVPKSKFVPYTTDPNAAYVNNNVFNKNRKSTYATFNISELIKTTAENCPSIKVSELQLALTGEKGGALTLFNFGVCNSIDSLQLGEGKYNTSENFILTFDNEDEDTQDYSVTKNEDGSITILLKRAFYNDVLKFVISSDKVIALNDNNIFTVIDYIATDDISLVRGDYSDNESRVKYFYYGSDSVDCDKPHNINIFAMTKQYKDIDYVESDDPEMIYVILDAYVVSKMLGNYPRLIAQFNYDRIDIKYDDGSVIPYYNTKSDRKKLTELIDNYDILPVYVLVLKSAYVTEGMHYIPSEDRPEGAWVLFTEKMIEEHWGNITDPEPYYTFNEIVELKRAFIKSECQRHIEKGISLDLGLTDESGSPLGTLHYSLSDRNQLDMRDLASLITAGSPIVTWRDDSRVSHMIYTAEQFMKLYQAATEHIFRCRFRSDGLEELLATYTEEQLDKIQAISWSTKLPPEIQSNVDMLLAAVGIN